MNKENEKRNITLIIIFSIVLIFFFSNASIGKETSKTKIETKAEIARPIIEIENSEMVDITNSKNEGIYEFKIKNYDKTGNITEVDMEYNIEILSEEDKNLTFKIYKEDKEIEINGNKTKSYLLSKDKKQEDNYKIEIIYEKDRINYEVANEIKMKVLSEQLFLN